MPFMEDVHYFKSISYYRYDFAAERAEESITVPECQSSSGRRGTGNPVEILVRRVNRFSLGRFSGYTS